MTNIERYKRVLEPIDDAIEELGSVISSAGGRGYDALLAVKDLVEEFDRLRHEHQGAVDALERIARLNNAVAIATGALADLRGRYEPRPVDTSVHPLPTRGTRPGEST